MRIKQAYKLANSKIRRYKRRTLLAIIPVCLFFSVSLVAIFILASLSNILIKANENSGEKLYVRLMPSVYDLGDLRSVVADFNGQVLEWDDYNIGLKDDALVMNDGRTISLNLKVLPSEIRDLYIDEGYSDSEIPVLVDYKNASILTGEEYDPTNKSAILGFYNRVIGRNVLLDYCVLDANSNDYACNDSIHYKIVGIVPGNSNSENETTEIGDGLIRQYIDVSSRDGEGFYVAANTSEFNRYYTADNEQHNTLLSFEKSEDLLDFLRKYNDSRIGDKYGLKFAVDYFGETLNIEERIIESSRTIIVIIFIFLIGAIFAFSACVVKIIDDDSSLINLYEMLGASSADIKFIYLLYITKATAITAGLSVLFGYIISGIILALNKEAIIASIWSTFGSSYNKTPIDRLNVVFDWDCGIVVIGIILSGLIGYLLSIKLLKRRK